MKITEIRFAMLRVPLKTPFKTALRTVDAIEDIVVMVHTDTGHVGYGEAPATAVITGDTHGSIIEAIRKIIAPRLIGEDVANLNRITRLIQGSLEKNSSAKAAVEIAIYDLFAQLYGARHIGVLFGVVMFVHQCGSFLGIWLSGIAFERYGSYEAMWMLDIALALAAIGLNLSVRTRPRPTPDPTRTRPASVPADRNAPSAPVWHVARSAPASTRPRVAPSAAAGSG